MSQKHKMMSSDWPAKSLQQIGSPGHRISITLKIKIQKFPKFEQKFHLDIFEIFAAQSFDVSKMEYFLSYLFSWRAYAELDINCVNNYYENFTIFIIMFNDFWKFTRF